MGWATCCTDFVSQPPCGRGWRSRCVGAGPQSQPLQIICDTWREGGVAAFFGGNAVGALPPPRMTTSTAFVSRLESLGMCEMGLFHWAAVCWLPYVGRLLSARWSLQLSTCVAA